MIHYNWTEQWPTYLIWGFLLTTIINIRIWYKTLLINTYIFGGWGWRWWQDIDKPKQQHQHMYNMYITINIKSTTDILTAINVTDVHMIWEKFLTEFKKHHKLAN